MSIVISTVRQDGVGKLTVYGVGAGTWYVYPPFKVLFTASEEGSTKFVLRAETADHVIFVNDQQSLEILSGFPRLHDDGAAKAALDRHDAQINRAEERKNALQGPPTATMAAPSAPPAPEPRWATNPNNVYAGRPLTASARRANGTAKAVEALAWIGALLGLIAGIVVATRTDSDGYDNSHPYIGIGILIIVISVAQALPTIMIAAYIQSRTE